MMLNKQRPPASSRSKRNLPKVFYPFTVWRAPLRAWLRSVQPVIPSDP